MDLGKKKLKKSSGIFSWLLSKSEFDPALNIQISRSQDEYKLKVKKIGPTTLQF